ncbi:MAG: SelL-related redox protein [Verrucomicrobiia bacterium]|jgi:peroxiredoxin
MSVLTATKPPAPAIVSSDSPGTSNPAWMSRVLILAGVYNLAWGACVVIAPATLFEWAGMEPPRYQELWQCIGMIVGVYGLGYVAAAMNPAKHWPIVMVGLVGKILGPIGFADALMSGRFSPEFAWVILFNDLIWWLPFGLILLHARRSFLQGSSSVNRHPEAAEAMLAEARTQNGQDLLSMSNEAPLLIVFLRHFGCTFCREALSDLASKQVGIQATGSKIVFVHMSQEAKAAEFFGEYGLSDVARVSDPTGKIYQTFDLHRGNWKQLAGWQVLKRGLEAGLVQRHGVGQPVGDFRQMPGVFLIYRGELLKSFRHKFASDRPDYGAMANLWPFNLARSVQNSGGDNKAGGELDSPRPNISDN